MNCYHFLFYFEKSTKKHTRNIILNFWFIRYILVLLCQKGGVIILNQTVIVGRIVRDPELRETDSGSKITNITLAVPRSFKNPNGEYETDFISCILWKGVAENVVEYCKRGDLVGVKGRIQSRNIEEEDKKKQVLEVVAEKVTF